LFENYGTIKAETVSTSGLFKNHQAIFCEVAFEISAEFINEAGAALVTLSFVTYGDVTNNGDVSAFGWTHDYGIATGETGKFCVEDCFVNFSTIEGTIDICDASPDGICDLNMGTIAGSVTLCESSPCIINLSINNETQITEINAFPNPTNGLVTLDLSSLNKISSLQIYNMNGQSLMEVFDPSSSIYTIDLGNLAKGTYICQIQNEELIWQQLIVVQ
ncbi:MAG: T9SS type A sorting domain-containing protein, partial [Crocinitomix sp.]|nr:T9SS type A sorting domain-containing protein [Crocinitomix sp.]